MEAAGRHEQQPLQLESSDEEENASQQVNFVTDPKDDDELFEMAKLKKSLVVMTPAESRPMFETTAEDNGNGNGYDLTFCD